MSNPTILLLASLAALLFGCAKKDNLEMDPKMTESDLTPPADVTRDIFSKWRDARRGTSQAEKQNNPYWKWILESEISAYLANEHFSGPSSYGGNPAWEASRFGQSTTALPDGRQILIAGEHEDHYDPDFFIYNDVIIRHPDGQIDFLTYPIEDFIPTDFHSATLADNKIILIGNLGYPDDRKPEKTQILILDTNTWEISAQLSTGDHPGWIHRHSAELSADKRSIIIKGGIVQPVDPELPLLENIDDWCVHLEDWRWERLSERKWPLIKISRADEESNKLWEMRQAEWELKHGKIDLSETYKSLGQDLSSETLKLLNAATDYPLPSDSLALKNLYKPTKVSHKEIPPAEDDEDDEDDHSEFGVTRIEVDQVIVRYVENSYNILLTVEGELPEETIKALVGDLIEKLNKIEASKYTSKRIRG